MGTMRISLPDASHSTGPAGPPRSEPTGGRIAGIAIGGAGRSAGVRPVRRAGSGVAAAAGPGRSGSGRRPIRQRSAPGPAGPIGCGSGVMPSGALAVPADRHGRFPRLDLRDTATLDFGRRLQPWPETRYAPGHRSFHELVPWKEAKSCRDEPRNVVHEGSSIARRLQARGLVEGEGPAVRPEEPSDAPR
jgi:hypothetical protein